MCTFPCFCAGKFLSTGLCMYAVWKFSKKRYNLLCSCFVCNYVHINCRMSYIVLSLWLAVRWMWAQVFNSKSFFFFLCKWTNYFWCTTIDIYLLLHCKKFSADIVNIFMEAGTVVTFFFFFFPQFRFLSRDRPMFLFFSGPISNQGGQ